jgi:hypothetical protein
MIYAPDPKVKSTPPVEAGTSGVESERMTYEIHARRKTETEWHIIAQFKNDEDARASLWAIVFTCKYSEVQVRAENSTTSLAEWPAGMPKLNCTASRHS